LPAEDAETDFGPAPCEGELAPQALPIDADTTFLRGPYVQDVTTTSAVVVWRPAEPVTQEGCVHYTLDEAPLTACAMPDSRGQYEVRLTGLPPATAIPYSVAIGDTTTTVPMAFSTAPDDARPVRLLVFADGHRNDTVLRSIAEAGLEQGVDLAVSVGDLVSQPEEEQFDLALEGLRPLMHRVPMYAVLGNHEARGSSHFAAFVISGAAPDDPTERYFSVRHGDVWMGMLEVIDFQATQMFGVDTDQITWLKQELDSEAARTARWRLLFIHHPPWCQGWGHCDGYNGEDSLRELLVPLAAQKGVAAIFSGHMHGYERGEMDGVALVISGGGGGALDMWCPAPEGLPSPWLSDYAFHRVIVDANCDALAIEARALDGRLIDWHEIPYTAPGS
jgi:predicted phosphodiesterase